jgi:Tol biopolymer transport system component
MSAELFQFGDVTVDLRRGQIRRRGEVVAVEPKMFAVLQHLLLNRDRLVTQDELLAAVWADTFVTPNALTRAIAGLRKALGETPGAPRYIETVARRGYRFLASPGSPQPLTPRRLTTARCSHKFPSIAPDGAYVAYASDQSGVMEIYLSGVGDTGRSLRTTSDDGHNVHPALSPDGRWLAYHSRRRGGVWLVPPTGGPPRQLVEFGSMPAWSPDGETIVFTSDSGGMSSQAQLWTVRRDGGTPVPLTRLGVPAGGHLAPTWSHEGRWIAFRVGRHAQSDVWLTDVHGHAPRQIAAGTREWTPRFAPEDRPSAPQFSPDDNLLYWVGHTREGNDCVMRVRLDADGRAVGDIEPILPFVGQSVGGFSVARDGTAVFSLDEGASNLMAIDLDSEGHATRPIALTRDEVENTMPRFGPNGRICFEQQVVGRPILSWLMDEDGANREPLCPGMIVSVQEPQWDARGERVFAMVTEQGGDEPYFAWIDLATRRPARIPMPPCRAASPPQVSPDGRQLAFHVIDADGVMNVWLMDLESGCERQITFDPEAMTYPRWSQDGAMLSTVIKRGERTHVGVIVLEDLTVEQVTCDSGNSWAYSFSPDGERLAFAGERHGAWNIYTVSRRTGEVRQLTDVASANGFVRYPAWSPRGTRIVFVRAETRGTLWTVNLPS